MSLGFERPKKGTDCGDHPPITPMRCAERHQLDHDSWRLYEYITKYFIGTVSRRLEAPLRVHHQALHRHGEYEWRLYEYITKHFIGTVSRRLVAP